MKKFITLFLSLALFIPAFAQDEEELVKDTKAQEKIKAARIAFITEKLGLSPAEAEKFWPVYNEFAQKRKELRVQARETNATKPVDQTDKEAVNAQLQLRQKELDLEKEYSNKLLNVVPAQKVMALRKTETEFRNLLIKQIQQRQATQQQRQKQREQTDQRLKQRNN
jgi:hypothetical protein